MTVLSGAKLDPHEALAPIGASGSPGFDEAVLAIEAELGSPMGRVDRVGEACERLRAARGCWSEPASRERLLSLAALVTRRAGAVVEPVVTLLHAVAAGAEDAWPILELLLAAPAPRVALSALDLAVRLSDEGKLAVGRSRAGSLAALVEAQGSPLSEAAALEHVAKLLPAGDLTERYAGGAPRRVRRLFARVLDLSGEPPGPELAARMLGEDPLGADVEDLDPWRRWRCSRSWRC
jgi:hypothetical protein